MRCKSGMMDSNDGLEPASCDQHCFASSCRSLSTWFVAGGSSGLLLSRKTAATIWPTCSPFHGIPPVSISKITIANEKTSTFLVYLGCEDRIWNQRESGTLARGSEVGTPVSSVHREEGTLASTHLWSHPCHRARKAGLRHALLDSHSAAIIVRVMANGAEAAGETKSARLRLSVAADGSYTRT